LISENLKEILFQKEFEIKIIQAVLEKNSVLLMTDRVLRLNLNDFDLEEVENYAMGVTSN